MTVKTVIATDGAKTRGEIAVSRLPPNGRSGYPKHKHRYLNILLYISCCIEISRKELDILEVIRSVIEKIFD